MDDLLTNRIAPVFMGIFLFFFGLPFTLVPFMIFLDGAIDPSYPFAALFMIAFVIPFLMAGLFVQFMGLSMIRTGIIGPKDPTSIPRELPPGPDAISITEHPDQSYIGAFFRQSEAINGRDWYRKEETLHRLYYYAQNEGGAAGWSLDDRDDSGRRDWFDGGWFPYEGFELPIGRKQWNVDDGQWVSIEELEPTEDDKKWWQ
ncbi:MAG TPA: hypothetical protein HA315_01615 [Candidatus Thalassarchaeaceae archaeon]|jgi:hypothetical protein|nr:hypothetical protein [Euryarchaeota archaeon]DAC44597.1 MAG TPA: hypothetical protein D7H72_01610 [Candidatus Poseidoniales archaeon]HII34679.1 hypothetical protein [Candidatus Thalassarchaeaceae archaeon]|tara:strand:- start:4526 stop:5131 length:606 start_codon:yes stop_codon:yes gene_type:complete